MAQENLQRDALWLYSTIVALAIREALTNTAPHIISLPAEPPGGTVADIFRLIVFLIVIVRYYLFSAIFFDYAHTNVEQDKKSQRRSIAVEFLPRLAHFLVFFFWAFSIDVHSKPILLFPGVLSIILFYDLFWFIVRYRYDKYDEHRIMRRWAAVNILTLIVSGGLFFALLYLMVDERIAEFIAFSPILIINSLDIMELLSQGKIFEGWFAWLVPKK